jgi:hypothetical protein
VSLQLQQATVARHPLQRLAERRLHFTGLAGAVQDHHIDLVLIKWPLNQEN